MGESVCVFVQIRDTTSPIFPSRRKRNTQNKCKSKEASDWTDLIVQLKGQDKPGNMSGDIYDTSGSILSVSGIKKKS